MKREVRFALLTTLALATIGAPSAPAQSLLPGYTGQDGQISLMLYHTQTQVTGNWICSASQSSALDTDGSGVIENDECYAYLPTDWDKFGNLCTQGGLNSSLELLALDGDKPGRRGNAIYHLVEANNQTKNFPSIPQTGPGRATDTKFLEGDNFVLFKCPVVDPNCKNTAPILINATLRPDNEDCGPNGLTDPACDRYNWQVKSTNEFPPNYDKLEVWAKLQNTGVKFTHDDPNILTTGQLQGAAELFLKDAVAVMNQTNTAVPFSDPNQRRWAKPFATPLPPGQGWENAFVFYMDNRWCDDSFDISPTGGCPSTAGPPVEARLTDVQIERRVITRSLPKLTGTSDTGHCTLNVTNGCTMESVASEGVGFLNFLVDTDRDVLAQNNGLCINTAKGGVKTCPNGTSPTVPASCASRTNISPECKPVIGCNCCEPVGACANPFKEERSAFVVVDTGRALFFPEYGPGGKKVVGWFWVKWGKVLSELPPLHPGINHRITEVNVATTSGGGQEWQFWQRRKAEPLLPPPPPTGNRVLPIAACDQSATSSQVPTPPFTTNVEISSLSTIQQDAWECNVGTTVSETINKVPGLISKGMVLEYGTFNPTSGVITTMAGQQGDLADDGAMHTVTFTNPHMPPWYNNGIYSLAGFLEVKNSSGAVTYRSIAWGGTPQMACNVANTTNQSPGRAVMYEKLTWP